MRHNRRGARDALGARFEPRFEDEGLDEGRNRHHEAKVSSFTAKRLGVVRVKKNGAVKKRVAFDVFVTTKERNGKNEANDG